MSLIFAAAALAQTGPATAAFDEANKLYAQGKFTDAAAAYQGLMKSGQTSAAVCFNLGNAFFKAGQIGQAIAAYRAAEALTPRDPDVQANLRFARNQVQGPTLAIPTWHRWLGRLSLNEWTLTASVVAWVWLLLLAIRQWRPGLKLILRGYVLAAGAAALVLSACLAVDFHLSRTPIAVVTASEAVIRQAPLAESDRVFTARDGAELPVVDHKDEWLQVSPNRSRVGWIRKDQLLVINGG